MLLETLDVKKNDIIIYSQNIFNLDKNFKIIFKDDREKLPRTINLSNVCSFINEFTPKNLIVYRLLTNVKDFQLEDSRYGILLNINDQTELIYLDPVFAVKELEKYKIMMDINDLRFRIQQVGLTTLNRKGGLPNFAEIYAVDLEGMEAKFQNDKILADAITAFSLNQKGITEKEAKTVAENKTENGEKRSKEKNEVTIAEKIRQTAKEISSEQKENIKEIKHEISEDKDFDYTQIMKMSFKGKSSIEKTETPKSEPGKDGSGLFSEFLKKKRSDEKVKKIENEKNDFVDIFKSSVPLKEYISSKQDKKVVLKLDRK